MDRTRSLACCAIMAYALTPPPCHAEQPYGTATSTVSIGVRILPRPEPPAYSIFNISNTNALHITTNRHPRYDASGKQSDTLIVRHNVTKDSCSIGTTIQYAQDDRMTKRDQNLLVMLVCDESLSPDQRLVITTENTPKPAILNR